MVKWFQFIPIPLKNKEGFGEGPSRRGGLGGVQPPPTTPDGKNHHISFILSIDFPFNFFCMFLQFPIHFTYTFLYLTFIFSYIPLKGPYITLSISPPAPGLRSPPIPPGPCKPLCIQHKTLYNICL